MKITLSSGSGFCPGVKRADITIRNLLSARSENERIYTLGALIHNRCYTDELHSLGVNIINFEDVENTLINEPDILHTVVIRTHGITKEQNKHLDSLCENYSNMRLIDMTCPSVKKIHRIAEKNTNNDTCFILFCNPKHPEAIGIMSYAN